MRRLVIIILLLCIGCHKDIDDPGRYINDFIGHYCGTISQVGSWASYSTPVWRSETNSNKVAMEYFMGLDTAWFTVNGYHLSLDNQSYRETLSTSAGPWGQVYHIDWNVSASGDLNPYDHSLHIEAIKQGYIEEWGEDVEEHYSIDIINSEKYSYTGTYSDDTVTVIITPYNDSLQLSVIFPDEWTPTGWENIKASETPCSIHVDEDSIADRLTGEFYRIRGGGQKLGDSLRFTIFAYFHDYSPLYICEFTVHKIMYWEK